MKKKSINPDAVLHLAKFMDEVRLSNVPAVEEACWLAADTIRDLIAERDGLRLALSNLLSVMPVFPEPARQIVGMEDRYNQVIKQAKEVNNV